MLATAPTTEVMQHVIYARNPVLFAQMLGINPDEWQRRVLRSTSDHIILNCARQTGKSTIVSVLALHHALYTPNALVLVISHIYRQATETFRKIVSFYRRIEEPASTTFKENVHGLELHNGSRIITLSGSHPQTIRGFSGPTLVIVDEAAQVDDVTYAEALRPMLAVSQGRIVLLSTPHGRRGFFWHAWELEEGWHRERIVAEDCPRISPEYLAEEKLLHPNWLFEQEYHGFFAEGTSSVFKVEDIEAAFRDDLFTIDLDMEAPL